MITKWRNEEEWISAKMAWIAVGIITLLGLALRLINLGALSLWVDEYPVVMEAMELLRGEPLEYKKALVNTYTVKPLFRVFGPSELVARFPNALFGALCIPLIYLLGKRLFNRSIALIAATAGAFSLYTIFWSRVCRDYSNLELFFLVLLLVFTLALPLFDKAKKSDSFNGFKDGFHIKWLLLVIPALAFAFINHTLSLFFVFGLGLFAIGLFLINIKTKWFANIWLNPYAALAYPAILGFILIGLPAFRPITESLLAIFLPEKAVAFIIPNGEYLSKVWNNPETKYQIFNRYKDVLTTDLHFAFIPGIIGFVLSWFYKKASGLFLTAFFLFIFLLMSFLFRDPALPRYLLFIYPLFLLAVAVTIHFLVFAGKHTVNAISPKLAFFASMVLILAMMPWGKTKDIVFSPSHGQVIPMELSHWNFTNWKQPLQDFLKPKLQPQEVVISTVRPAAAFYLDRKRSDIIWFRQLEFDPVTKSIVPRKEKNPVGMRANSLADLKQTMQQHPRGWLVADYYFDMVGSRTDGQTRSFVLQQFTYHFDASEDGKVKIFSWDNTKPAPKPRQFILLAGKNPEQMATRELPFNLQARPQGKIRLRVDVEGLDSAKEGVVRINRQHSAYIPAPPSNERHDVVLDLPGNWFAPGQNIIQFQYNEEAQANDKRKGFAVYNISF